MSIKGKCLLLLLRATRATQVHVKLCFLLKCSLRFHRMILGTVTSPPITKLTEMNFLGKVLHVRCITSPLNIKIILDPRFRIIHYQSIVATQTHLAPIGSLTIHDHDLSRPPGQSHDSTLMILRSHLTHPHLGTGVRGHQKKGWTGSSCENMSGLGPQERLSSRD